MNGIAKRLEARFGLGSMPLVRKRLYMRIERMCHNDEVAYQIVAEVANTATKKDDPGVWFAAAVTRRLAEMGYPCTSHTREVLAERERHLVQLEAQFTPPAEGSN